MKLRIKVGGLDLTGDSVADLLAKVRALSDQKTALLIEVEKRYKAIKKEAAQFEKARKELEAASSVVPPVEPPSA